METPPWDMTPASDGQVDYLRQVFASLAEHDWSTFDTGRATNLIDKANQLRRLAGISFRPF